MKHNLVDQNTLAYLFDYREGERYHKGTDTLATTSKGEYKQISVVGKTFRAHRMIYLLLKGEVPKILDHANRNKHDNRIENLRPATSSQNMANVVRNDNGTGFKGVRFNKSKNRYFARITCDGLTQSFGYFETGLEAAEVYDRKAKELFGEFAVLNFPNY